MKMAGEEHVVKENSPSNIKNKKSNKTILDNFRKLTHNNEKTRLKSGLALLKYLTENTDTENGEQELKYALGRLIRGLGASQNTSKIGFYTVLVALLNCIDLKVSEILEHVKSHLHSSGSNSKSENADISAGQILLYGALIRTNLYEKATVDEKKFIIEHLLAAGKKRQYLYLSTVTFLIELCEKTNEVDFKTIIWPLIKSEIGKPWSEQNIDTLYLFSALGNKFRNIVNKKFLLEIYSKDNFKQLSSVLLDIPRITVANHPFYEIVCSKISMDNLAVEFINVVDESLLKYNYNRHFVVTNIITYCMKTIPNKNVIADLLCKNYIQHTLQYFKSVKGSKNPETLQERIYNLFNTIIEILKQDQVQSDTKINVLKKLMFCPGIFIFEKITRSKVVQHIISTFDFDGVKQLSKLYRDVISGKNSFFIKDDEKQHCLNNDRVYASQLLVKLLTHPASNNQIDWKIEQLKFLMRLSLFKIDDTKNVSVELAASLKETFYRALAIKLPKLTDLRNLLSQLAFEIRDHINNQKLLRNPLTDEALTIWNEAIERIQKLETKHKKVYKVFHTLLLHMSLQLFNDVKLATDSLKELFSCYERVRSQKKQPDGGVASEDPMWIEVVVDLFLNLLSHKSYLLRNLIGCVFPHLCKYLNLTALHQILDTLDPENEGNPLISNSDESDSEAEEVGAENESESEESSDEAEDVDDNVNDKLKMAVQMALGGSVSDEESVDLDEMSDSEGDRLDEALATAFKQYKPNIGKKSNRQKKEDEALTHFRVRVLDLVDVYLDSEPSMYLCLQIMIVLLRSLEFSIKDDHQRPLVNRIRSSLKKLSELKKFSSIEDVDESTLPDLLNSLLEKGTKNYFVLQEMNDKISECSLFVVRCVEHMNSLEEVPSKFKKHVRKAVITTISNALDMYLTKRESYVPYGLFKSVLQLNWNGNFKLIPSILQYSFSDSVKTFKKNHALELAKIFFGNHRLLNANANQTKLDECLEEFSENTLRILNDAENGHLKDKYIRELINTLSVLRKSPVNQSHINWLEIGNKMREIRANFAFAKETKVAYNRLCRILGIDAQVKLNANLVKLGKVDAEKSDDEDQLAESKMRNEEESGTKKKKKEKIINKKKHKTKNSKKDSQMLRMQSLSDGLSVDFTGANLKDERLDAESDRKRMKPDESEEVEDINGIENVTISRKKSKKASNLKQKQMFNVNTSEESHSETRILKGGDKVKENRVKHTEEPSNQGSNEEVNEHKQKNKRKMKNKESKDTPTKKKKLKTN